MLDHMMFIVLIAVALAGPGSNNMYGTMTKLLPLSHATSWCSETSIQADARDNREPSIESDGVFLIVWPLLVHILVPGYCLTLAV